VPWLRRLVAGLPQWRPGFDRGSFHVGLVVDKVALGQGFPRVFRYSSVSFIPPVLHNKEKRKKLMTFITGLHNKPHGRHTSVASAVRPFTPPPPKKRATLLRSLKCNGSLPRFTERSITVGFVSSTDGDIRANFRNFCSRQNTRRRDEECSKSVPLK
jgi:hypothetical protein